MKILLLGKNGQVGWELQRALAPLGEIIALGRQNEGSLCGDLSDLEGLAATVRRVAPQLIVNAAAYTAVDKAESEPQLAHCINAEAPAVLAREASALNAWLVHYSTDYVFDGSGTRPWQEEDPTNPLSVYGSTKLAGETAIQSSNAKALIFRTSWVYAARGGNFARTMLRLAQERDALNVVNDQIGAPTSAELIADVTAHAVREVLQSTDPTQYNGIYHLVASGETSWYEYALMVLQYAQQAGLTLKVGPDSLGAIPTEAYPTPAQRPGNSRLSEDKLQGTFQLHMPSWQQGVQRMLAEIIK